MPGSRKVYLKIMKKDLVSIKDLTAQEISGIFLLTDKLKKNSNRFAKAIKGKTLGLIFQKPSNRTRVSFEVGMYQLGGNALYLSPEEINLGVRESIADVAKTLSRYLDGIVLRTFEHDTCLKMASFASIPIINGLSDYSHPCQALADLYTIKEKLKSFKGITLAYIGDGNNVCNSLLFACAKLGVNMNVGSPFGYQPKESILQSVQVEAETNNSTISLFDNAKEAIENADVIYTDVWTSMGQEEEALARKKAFESFQVNKNLLKLAKDNVLIMHCLPAHRGEEITDEVLDSKNSIIFDQAENRLHVQKAILIKLLRID